MIHFDRNNPSSHPRANSIRGKLVLAGGPGGRCRVRIGGRRGRKVRTPQGSVLDNVWDVRLKAHGRPVPQKTYRLG